MCDTYKYLSDLLMIIIVGLINSIEICGISNDLQLGWASNYSSRNFNDFETVHRFCILKLW